MDYLDAVFNMWLAMLHSVVHDDIFGSMLWVFILVIIALFLLMIWRGVFSWKR